MKHWLAGLLLLIGPPALAQQAVPQIAFDSVPNPLKLPPNMYFGEASGVSVNSKGHVFVLSRGNTSGPAYAAAATQLLEFDAKGAFVREIGKNLYAWSFGHTVKIDPADNIWVTDKGSDMVIKFDPEGRVVMVFGRKQEASDEDTAPLKHPKPPLPAEDGRFRQVTDVAWDKDGNTFISDGYINSRVAKVDKDGNWLKSWGERGKEPGQFNTPHSIATDAKGNVYVADRGNHRIQVFDENGKYLYEWSMGKDPSDVHLLYIGADRMLWAYDRGTSRMLKYDLEGHFLYSWGTWGDFPGGFWGVHGFSVDQDGNFYTAEVDNGRAQKFTPRPGANPAYLVSKPIYAAWK